jgi:hypothetical protein
MDRREPAGVSHISYPDAVPGDAAVPVNGVAGPVIAPDWSLYDTGHAVFRPKHMSPEELEHGYA